jgi:CBS domain-containing protein
MRISDILRHKGSDIATVSPDATIAQAIATLAERNIGALVVSSDSNPIAGILSERDIVRSLSKVENTLSEKVSTLMTTDVFTCGPDATTAELMELMTKNHFRHVPVAEKGQLVGLVSIGDVVSVRLHELEEERQQIEEYITVSPLS